MLDFVKLSTAAALVTGCSAYTNGTGTVGDAAVPFELDAGFETEAEPEIEAAPELDTGAVPGASVPLEEPPEMLDPVPTGDLRFARSAKFDTFLTDAAGRALYMFVNDTPERNDTACLNACAQEWPPFDVPAIQLGSGIDPTEVSRFHRQDGAWQTRFKGHPLYYRANEPAAQDAPADGTDGRWFVARDYLAFMISPPNFSTIEAPEVGARALTDGYGHTLYICLDDQPEAPGTLALSSCSGECLSARPPWVVRATNRTTALPSVIPPSDLRAYVRPDGVQQLLYRGWPVYYFRGDPDPGATVGHNQKAWRAFDPVSFGLDPTAAVGN